MDSENALRGIILSEQKRYFSLQVLLPGSDIHTEQEHFNIKYQQYVKIDLLRLYRTAKKLSLVPKSRSVAQACREKHLSYSDYIRPQGNIFTITPST